MLNSLHKYCFSRFWHVISLFKVSVWKIRNNFSKLKRFASVRDSKDSEQWQRSLQNPLFYAPNILGNKLCGPPLTDNCSINGVRPNNENKGVNTLVELKWIGSMWLWHLALWLGFGVYVVHYYGISNGELGIFNF